MFPDTCCIKQTPKVTGCEMCLQYPEEATAFCHKPNKNICNCVTDTWKIGRSIKLQKWSAADNIVWYDNVHFENLHLHI